MEYYAASDTGRVRQTNEDFCFATTRQIGGLSNLFVVCDGMGGHRAGEYASSLAVAKMLSRVREYGSGDPFEILSAGIEGANRAIYELSQSDPDKAGMGTTLVAATVEDSTLYAVNVGDSRLYCMEKSGLRQITRDHSYVAEMVQKGLLDSREARFHRDRNKITRAIGVLPGVRIDYFDFDVIPGMQVLLCTDGLTGMLYDEEIRDVLDTSAEPKEKTIELIGKANERGGTDNITVVLVEI